MHCLKALQQCAAEVPLPTAPGLCSRSSPVCCPQAVWQCLARVPMPTAPRHCGGVPDEFQCPLPPRQFGIVEQAHCPLPQDSLPQDSLALCRNRFRQEFHCSKRCTAHCPKAARHYVARLPLHNAHRQCRGLMPEFHCPQLHDTAGMCCGRSTARCPKALRRCSARFSVPTGEMRCGSVWQELH